MLRLCSQCCISVVSECCISAASAASLQPVLHLQLVLNLCSWACSQCFISVASAASPKLVLHFYRQVLQLVCSRAACFQLVLHLCYWWCISAVRVTVLHLVLYLCCVCCISAADALLFWLVLHWFFHFHAVYSDFGPPCWDPKLSPLSPKSCEKPWVLYFCISVVGGWCCVSTLAALTLQLMLQLCNRYYTTLQPGFSLGQNLLGGGGDFFATGKVL